MKRIMIFTLFILLILTVAAQSQNNESKIFFVNLYNDILDLRLGEDDNYVFLMIGLEPNASTALLKTQSFGDYYLYVKENSSREWIPIVDDAEQKIRYKVEPDKNHCIIAGPDGIIDYYIIEEEQNTGAKVCFLNGSNDTVSRMEVSADWENNVVAYTEDLAAFVITDFVTIDNGDYSIFWQYPSQKEIDSYYFYPNEEGNKEIIKFEDDNYYLFFCFTIGRNDYASIIMISP